MRGRARTWTGYHNSAYGQKCSFKCQVCGRTFERYLSSMKSGTYGIYKHHFCSNKCKGKHLANTAGKAALLKILEARRKLKHYTKKVIDKKLSLRAILYKLKQYLPKSPCCNALMTKYQGQLWCDDCQRMIPKLE